MILLAGLGEWGVKRWPYTLGSFRREKRRRKGHVPNKNGGELGRAWKMIAFHFLKMWNSRENKKNASHSPSLGGFRGGVYRWVKGKRVIIPKIFERTSQTAMTLAQRNALWAYRNQLRGEQPGN